MDTFKHNKKGAWKTSSVVLTIIGATMAAALIVGSASLVFVFFNYVRPSSQSASAAQTVESVDKDTAATTITGTTEAAAGTSSGKHFSVSDAATLPDSGDKVALSTTEIASKVGPATVSILAELSNGDRCRSNFTSYFSS